VARTIAQIHRAHDRWIDSLTADYDKRITAAISKAQSVTVATLFDRLEVRDGKIAPTAANRKVLRDLNRIWQRELRRAGFDKATQWFSKQFPGQLTFLNETLEWLNGQLPEPLPKVTLPAAAIRDIASAQLAAPEQVASEVEQVGIRARTQALMQVGAVSRAELAATLSDTFGLARQRATAQAETAISTYYRTATDRTFGHIEKETGRELLYQYSGPSDKLTRPFCRRLLAANLLYTRAQIGKMSNGQLPNVMRTGGGWRCRHQWLLAGYKRGKKVITYVEDAQLAA
jgi:hypothetical protein